MAESPAQLQGKLPGGRQAGLNPLWRRLLASLPVVALASFTTAECHKLGWLNGIEGATLDVLNKLNPLTARHVLIVGINNTDYQQIFGARSPLNPERLSELIKAVIAGKPREIVVDINTADPVFAGLGNLQSGSTKIIYARGSTPTKASSSGARLAGDPVLGRRNVGSQPGQMPAPLWGMSVFPRDSDGIIRHYCRFVPIQIAPGTGLAPSLALVAARAYSGTEGDLAGLYDKLSTTGSAYPAPHPPLPFHNYSIEPRILRFTAGSGSKYWPGFSAGDLSSLYRGAGWQQMAADKIVLIGSYYNASGDSFKTPAGRAPGVELQAAAIETELQGGYRDINYFLLLALQTLCGIIAICLNHWIKRGSLVNLVLLMVPASALAYSACFRDAPFAWIDLSAVLVAIQLQLAITGGSGAAGGKDGRQAADETARQAMRETLSGPQATPAPRLKMVCLSCGEQFADATLTHCPADQSELSKIIDDDIVGTKLAERYQILSLIGEGGMSTVYKAHHLLLGKTVAIKVLHPHLESNTKVVMRFKREARSAVLINHPNVVAVYDFDITENGKAFMVMDYVEGRSLEELLEERGHLDAQDTVALFLQVCDGLSCIHEHGIMHRDLKPSNIMLIEQGGKQIVKIVDFGLAKSVGSDQKLTASGQVVGTPVYMSPEHFSNEAPDQRSDIYSLACIMYECLAGQPPFQSDNPMNLFFMHCDDKVPEFDHALNVPDWLGKTIFVALSKRPEHRFASVAELKTCLLNQNCEHVVHDSQ